jgi:hypothetical protein
VTKLGGDGRAAPAAPAGPAHTEWSWYPIVLLAKTLIQPARSIQRVSSCGGSIAVIWRWVISERSRMRRGASCSVAQRRYERPLAACLLMRQFGVRPPAP